MLKTAMAALLSHWLRRPLQLAMLLVGLSLATALWSGVQAINAEARASYDRAAALLGQDRLEQLVAADGGSVSEEAFVALRRAGWLVSPVIEGAMRFGAQRIEVIGIEPLTLPAGAMPIDPGSQEGGLTAFLSDRSSLYVAAETAQRLAGEDVPPLVVAGGVPPGTAIADIGFAQVLLNEPGRVSRLIVAPDQPLSRQPLAEAAPGLVLRAPEPQADLARLTDSFHLNLTAFGLLAFIVGMFIVYSAIGLAFEQRRPVFRTLRALGLPLRALVGLLLGELTLFALLAGVAGVALGWLVGAALLPDVAATLRGLYGAQVEGTLALRPQWWAAGLAMAMFGTLAASAHGLWRIARMPLLQSARPRAWARAAEASLPAWAAAGAALLLLAGALLRWGAGLAMGFAALAALLLGAALLLPVLAASCLAAAGRVSRGPLAAWFFADARQQLPGLSLALMALLLALSANVGVGTMVSSFRLTFAGWLDQRLAAELYVSARDEAQAAAMREWLEPRVDAVLPNWSVEGEVAGMPATIQGVADHATYRDNWPLIAALPDAWDRVARGEAVLINEQLARRLGLAPGDPVTLGESWRTSVAGVYSDYGNPAGHAVTAVSELTRRYPQVPRLRYALRVDPAGTEGLAEALRETFELPREAVVDQAAVKRLSLEIFERTFAVTAALNLLTLGVAGLAIFASLTALSGMRLPQIAPVWAAGVTRRRLAGLEFARILALAGLTLLAALPVGIALAWILLAVINVEAFGWRLPMHLFPFEWARLAALAFAAAGLAALAPLMRLWRLAPADLVKVFADER